MLITARKVFPVMSSYSDPRDEQLKRLDALGRELSAELTSSREESRVVSENLAMHADASAESARKARISAEEALERAAAIRLTTEGRTRKAHR